MINFWVFFRISRFEDSHGSPTETVAIAKTANRRNPNS